MKAQEIYNIKMTIFIFGNRIIEKQSQAIQGKLTAHLIPLKPINSSKIRKSKLLQIMQWNTLKNSTRIENRNI